MAEHHHHRHHHHRLLPSDLDRILEELGSFGTYNVINYALLLVPCYLAGMYNSVFVFEAPDLDYRCKITECETTGNNTEWLEYAIPKFNGIFSKCRRYAFSKDKTINKPCTADMFLKSDSSIEHCSSYVHGHEDTAVIDFNLFCQHWKRTMIGTIHNLGFLLSLPLTGIISDKFGRILTISVTSLMNCLCGILRSFSTNYEMMIVFEFLETALGAGVYTTAFVLAMELVGPKGRVCGNTLINVLYVIGMMSLAGLSWALQSWRTLLIMIYTPAGFVFSYLWILNESARWLLCQGRFDEAAVILKRAARMNQVQLSDEILSPLHKLDKKCKELHDSTENKTPGFLKVMRSSILIKRLLTCSYLWITSTFVYYGLSIHSVSLGGNKYVNFMLVAFIEIPANFCCLMVLDRYGRKRVLIMAYFVSAVFCIIHTFISQYHNTLSLSVYVAGKFSITVAYSSFYVYVSELFPTNVRQSLLAIASAAGRMGAVLAPLTPLLALYHELPVILFAGITISGCLLVFTLPETINVSLPNSIEEAESLPKDNIVKQNVA